MTKVTVHIYNVSSSGSEKANNAILHINKIFKDGIGLGGIFHSAVEVYGDEEWSFGFVDEGSGVYSCPSGENSMYTLRTSFVIGETSLNIFMVNQILRELSREWPGNSYDPFAKNCNHFCDEFCERLGVPKLPGWVNRFANAGDIAMVAAENTALRFRQAKTEIVTASRGAYRFLVGVTSSVITGLESPSSSNRGTSPRVLQAPWLKNLVTTAAKPSSCAEFENGRAVDVEPQQHKAKLK